jgi:hypothetical protein
MRTSSIRLRANARLAILHEDYLEICDGNMLAAMLLSILIYWTDIKIAKKEENLWVWKSHTDFQEDLMFDKPGMKPPHRTTIKTAIDLLLKKKFIQWRRNPKMQLDQTRQYLLNTKAVQAAIDKLSPIVVKPTLQSLNNDNAMSENQQCNVEIPTSNTNDYSTEITDPEITEESTLDASASTRAQQNVIDFKKATDGRIKAVSSSHSHLDRGNDDEREEEDVPTEKMPAVKKGQGQVNDVDLDYSGNSSIPARHDILPGTPQSRVGPQRRLVEQKPGTSTPLNLAVTPPRGDQDDATSVQASRSGAGTPARHSGDSPAGTLTSSGAAQAAIPKRPRYRAPITMEKAQLTLEGGNVKQWYEEVRGVKVRMIDKNIKDCNALAECDGVTYDSLKATIEYLDTLKWVIEHDYAIDLHVLAGDRQLNFENNWPQVKRKLALKAKQEDTYISFDDYVGNGPEARAALLLEAEERMRNGTLAM